MFQKIPRRSRSCDQCDHTFEPHEHYFTLLLPGEGEEEWVRSDRCASCWEEQRSAVRWKSAVPASAPKEEREPLSFEEQLLALLTGEKDGARALLLALYLERQGVLYRTGRRKRKAGVWLDFSTGSGDQSFSVLQVDAGSISTEVQNALVEELHRLAEPAADLAESESEPAASEGVCPKSDPTSGELDVVCAPSDTS